MVENPVVLLLTRADDLLRLGIFWRNATLLPPSVPGSAGRLQAGDDAGLGLVFAPQAVLEQGLGEGLAQVEARLSGTSTIELHLSRGAIVELAPQPLLEALRGAGVVSSASLDDPRSLLELPAGLLAAPTVLVDPASDEAAFLVSSFAVQPSTAPDGGAGLWHLHLLAGFGTLRLDPLAPLPDDPTLPGPLALTGGDRARIVAEGRPGRVQATIALSALGATLGASLHNDRFGWDHRLALGRDQSVSVVSTGILYPFGHRAVSIKAARRRLPEAGPGAAALDVVERIVVVEPVRRATRHDFRFSAVAIAEPEQTVGLLLETFLRPLPDLRSPKLAERDDARARFTAAQAAVQATQANDPRTVEALAKLDFGSASDNARNLLDTQARLAGGDAEVAGLQASERQAQRQLDGLERQATVLQGQLFGADGQEDPGVRAQLDALNQQIGEQNDTINEIVSGIHNLQASLAQDRANLPGLQAQANADLAIFPRSFEVLLASGHAGAQAQQQAQEDITRLDAEIAHLDQFRAVPIIYQPQHGDGSPLLWSLRLDHQAGSLRLRLPLIFVADVQQEDDSLYPDFHALSDPQVQIELQSQWHALRGGDLKDAGHVDVAGAVVDLVQDAAPLPGDVHLVRGLQLGASLGPDGYAASLAGMQVVLSSLQRLLPGQGKLVTLVYAGVGALADVPLLPVPPFDIDFTGHADRSGGLVAPKFLADGLSRTMGPIALAALPDVHLPDLSAIYRDATLLGLSLGSLIKTVAGDVPHFAATPRITPLIDGGAPVGAEMAWGPLPLKSEGIFVAVEPPGATLVLTVRVAGDSTQTNCVVRNFALTLPPGADLVRLSFDSLSMTQFVDRAPDVKIEGPRFALGGDLALVEQLQTLVTSFLEHDPGIVVRQTPHGISASYGFALPSVTAGPFQLRNVAVSIVVNIPFDKEPVTVEVGFASPENPFTLSVLVFGGGGYFLIRMGRRGVDRLELSFDFGAFVAINFLVASGEVHAFGALRLVQAGDTLGLQASIRLGGSVSVLGLVSVAIELVLLLAYESAGNRMVGRATLVIEIDLPFFSRSITLDSGEWVLAGGAAPGALPASDHFHLARDTDAVRQQWLDYRSAFA